MQVSDQIVNQMLRNLPADQQEVMAGILTGEITHMVIDPSEDQFEMQDVPTVDKDGEPVLYKTGEKAGTQKTHKEKVLVQEGGKGVIIAHIKDNGQVIPVKDEKGRMWLRASRKRTDGEYGFESWSGLDSRIAANEQGILGGDQPTKEDLYAMAANLERNPTQYVTINGERHVDGFIIREVGNK